MTLPPLPSRLVLSAFLHLAFLPFFPSSCLFPPSCLFSFYLSRSLTLTCPHPAFILCPFACPLFRRCCLAPIYPASPLLFYLPCPCPCLFLASPVPSPQFVHVLPRSSSFGVIVSLSLSFISFRCVPCFLDPVFALSSRRSLTLCASQLVRH